MTNPFKKAEKTQAKLRMALIGPAGSGKTYTALKVAQGLGERVAVIDTERGSASKYADLFGFDVLELESFEPENYIAAIAAAEEAGYDVVVVDSLSHAWSGRGGILEFVDREAAKSPRSNSFGVWRHATPKHNRLVDAMLGSRIHVIATMRSKMEYVQAQGADGKTEIRKVGMQPVQRDGLEYEFDVVGDLDDRNTLSITKSRCIELAGQVIEKPGADLAATLAAWLGTGAPAPERPAPPPPTEGAPTPTDGSTTGKPPVSRPVEGGTFAQAFDALLERAGLTKGDVAQYGLKKSFSYRAVEEWCDRTGRDTDALVMETLQARDQSQPALT